MRKPPLKRFPTLYIGRKATLTPEEVCLLFSHSFIIEEKLDGTLTVKEHGNLYLMLEDMKYVHSVFYNKLPARYILVDVCHENGHRLKMNERFEIAKETGYPMPPLIAAGKKITPPRDAARYYTVLNNSRFGDEMREGFVVKSEEFTNLGGKYSRFDLRGEPRYTKDKLNHIIGARGVRYGYE